jgi:hypothetical protein
MNKKLIAMLFSLVLIPATLFSMPVVVTWEWMLEDPMVTSFRYQVDGEETSAWTVVDSSVTTYTVKGLDGSIAHTLYLQQSYDGVNFSASSLSSSEPILAEVPEEAPAMEAVVPAETAVEEVAPVLEEAVAPVAEEPVLAAEEPALVTEEAVLSAEEPAPLVEEPVLVAEEPVLPVEEPAVPAETAQAPVEEPAPVMIEAVVPVEEPMAMKESRYSTTLTLGGGAFYSPSSVIGVYGNKVPQITLGLNFNNLMSLGNHLGLGAEIAVSYDPMLDHGVSGWTAFSTDIFTSFSTTFDKLTQVASISIMPKLDLEIGKVDIALGGGGFFFYSFSDNLISEKYMYGAFAKGALAYNVTDWFSLGVDASYYWVLNDTTNPEIIKGSVFMGFSF